MSKRFLRNSVVWHRRLASDRPDPHISQHQRQIWKVKNRHYQDETHIFRVKGKSVLDIAKYVDRVDPMPDVDARAWRLFRRCPLYEATNG
jgi:hypothetical protein